MSEKVLRAGDDKEKLFQLADSLLFKQKKYTEA
jgi:hypothetical protein